MSSSALTRISALLLLSCLADAAAPTTGHEQLAAESGIFVNGERCIACHSGLRSAAGADVSIGYQWRASMMANSARDPYWHAGVRRETIDHPQLRAAIEDQCTTCHMPMGRTLAVHFGGSGELLKYLDAPATERDQAFRHLAFDGVSCSLCHQITATNQGQPSSFDGGYVVDLSNAGGPRPVYGPFDVDAGRQRVMQSSSTFQPNASGHIRQAEFCAGCHTLYTRPANAKSDDAEFPEQMPYREWLHSSYRQSRSCQDCHMPAVPEPVAISSVLGQPRDGVKRHSFVGGNAFMQRLLNRYRGELGVTALPQELEAAARDTELFLQTQTARITLDSIQRRNGGMGFDINIQNLSGHKLPTAYPSRRSWLHVQVVDGRGAVLFESGALRADGSIVGNDNDDDPLHFEPHHQAISQSGQVQVYEAIMVDASDRVTTGLLNAVRYIKDNRLLPTGFDKSTAAADVAVHGQAFDDPDFMAGADRVAFNVDTGSAVGPFTIMAEMRFQPIAFRWARNLAGYDAAETRRFVAYYDGSAAGSSTVLSQATATTQ